MNDYIEYMDYLWIFIEDDIITVGLNENGIDELDDTFTVELPEEDAILVPGEVCGELRTDQGSINLYSPVDGKVLEINSAAVDNPSLVLEDAYSDGWLFKIEVENIEDLRMFENEEIDDEDPED